MQTVHPHIRGAYPSRTNSRPSGFGSSPHTWGIRIHYSFPVNYQRFIPTYVGHTPGPTRSPVSHTVHPHIRGAYWYTSASFSASTGSSPHTWGIRRICPFAASRLRFIPTYVGHTGSGTPALSRYAVHPHIRGAYALGTTGVLGKIGSSPHTWGIRSYSLAASAVMRFIPTYVGHTLDRRKKNGWFQPLLL